MDQRPPFNPATAPPERPGPLVLHADYDPSADVASIAEDHGIPAKVKRAIMYQHDEIKELRRRLEGSANCANRRLEKFVADFERNLARLADEVDRKLERIAAVADRAQSDAAELAARLGRAVGHAADLDTADSDTTASDAEDSDDTGAAPPPRDAPAPAVVLAPGAAPAPRLAAEVGRGLGLVFGALADAARSYAR